MRRKGTVYDDIATESNRILTANGDIQILDQTKVEAASSRGSREQPPLTGPQRGFCIRCKSEVPANPAKPYCNRCFASWNRFKNAAYEEERCHICGDAHKTSLEKPLCVSCYRKFKDVLEFAA